MIPANLPGSWTASTSSGDFEVRHRWVICTDIKPVGEAPLMQVWLLDLQPTQAYEAKVCEPSKHY
jgi:hypothetical protein